MNWQILYNQAHALFTRKAKFLVDPKEPVEVAFVDKNGRKYFQFVDPFKTPSLRGLHLMVVYEELRQRTSREQLVRETESELSHIGNLEQALSGKSGGISLQEAFEQITKIKQILTFRNERLSLIWEPDLAYKFAAVVFFDENENPYSYDQLYAQKKIERWKQDYTIEAFFLQVPLVRLMPYLKEFEGNFQTYSDQIMMILKHQFTHPSYRKSKKVSMQGQEAK